MRMAPLGNRGKELNRKARKRPQVTYQTPLKELDRFVSALRPFMGELAASILVVEAVVFDPTHLRQLVSGDSLIDHVVEAHGPEESRQLLTAALADWVDFYFGTEPSTLVIYADHDEYVTLFPKNTDAYSRLRIALDNGGFHRVDYQRHL